MSSFDCQENIKKPVEDGHTISGTVAEKLIGDGLIITTIAAKAIGIFFGVRAMGAGQHNPLLTFTSLVWLFSLPVWKM